MDDSTIFLILGLCGFGVVVLGLIVFVFSLIFRFTGRNFMGFLTLLVRNSRDEDDNKPTVITRGRPNLRAIVDSQDFDAALAKHVVHDEGVVTNAELQAQQPPPPLPPSSPPLSSAPAPGFEDLSGKIADRRRRIDDVRRRAARDEDDDDLFGGMLDGG